LDFKSFNEFYPFYLSEHSRSGTKLLHFIGTLLVFVLIALYIYTFEMMYLYLMPICGYGFAWASHFFIEKNNPATFKHPLYSLRGDFLMFIQILTGRINI